MPAIPFTPLSENPDGTVNVYDEAFFSANGRLYATFDAGHVDFSTGELTPVIAGALYQIDPSTAHATLIGPTEFGIGAAAEVNGITYAFLNATGELATFDLTTGRTTVIGTYDAGVISAAAPTPEPASMAIAAFGLAVMAAAGWMRKRKVESYS
jgi:MYXO-CTERM domain-containing protein